MSHHLILTVPDDVYDALTQTAKNTGATPEQLAVEWLAVTGRHAAKDPLEKHIGAMPSTVLDWVEEHDKYLGQGAMDAQSG